MRAPIRCVVDPSVPCGPNRLAARDVRVDEDAADRVAEARARGRVGVRPGQALQTPRGPAVDGLEHAAPVDGVRRRVPLAKSHIDDRIGEVRRVGPDQHVDAADRGRGLEVGDGCPGPARVGRLPDPAVGEACDEEARVTRMDPQRGGAPLGQVRGAGDGVVGRPQVRPGVGGEGLGGFSRIGAGVGNR